MDQLIKYILSRYMKNSITKLFSTELLNTVFLCDWLRSVNLLYPIEQRDTAVKPITDFIWKKNDTLIRVDCKSFVPTVRKIEGVTVDDEKLGRILITYKELNDFSGITLDNKVKLIAEFVVDLASKMGFEAFDLFVNSGYSICQPEAAVAKSTKAKAYSVNVMKEVLLKFPDNSELKEKVQEEIQVAFSNHDYIKGKLKPCVEEDQEENIFNIIQKELKKEKTDLCNRVRLLPYSKEIVGNNEKTELEKVKEAIYMYIDTVIALMSVSFGHADKRCNNSASSHSDEDNYFDQDFECKADIDTDLLLDLKVLAECYRLQVVKR